MNRSLRDVPLLMILGLSLGASSAFASGMKRFMERPESKTAQGPVHEQAPLFPELEGSAQAIQSLCQELKKEVVALKWKLDPCRGIEWREGGRSVRGRPLVYAEFGDPTAINTTLVFSAVHGDEITPVYLGIQLALWAKEHEQELGKKRIVIAPLVNPDGFFVRPRTRTNARGVDLNRNLATGDWHKRAVAAWKMRYRADPRRNPGSEPHSEPETVFQEELVRRSHAQKVVSIHSPLNFLDYDGPSQVSLDRFPQEYVRECLKLRKRVKAVSGGFFPGSLGNYAGQELGIPTLTLELPTADPTKAAHYWEVFRGGIHTMIDFVVPDYSSINQSGQQSEPTDYSRAGSGRRKGES